MEHWIIAFDAATVTLPALQRACHQLSAKADLSVEADPTGRWLVRVHDCAGSTRSDFERCLRASVLDFGLRELIDAQTRTIRDTLVRVALAEAQPRQG